MVMVRLEKASKRYGNVVALREVDLSVMEGEFVTLLGPSGSGKTTMLNLIAGMLAPTSGSIHIAGKDMTQVPPNKRGLGMVFQNYALMPHMTIFENIAFPLRVRRMASDEIKKKVAAVLELVHLPHVAERKPRELSGGQQQRISLARCIVYSPSIILMDEPLGALDKKLRDQMQLEIKQLHTELGITALYVTHDQEEAMIMSDRICLMNEARIEQLGTPADLYFKPRTVFAAGFLGESNLLEATVEAVVGDRTTVKTPDGALVRAPTADGIAVGQAVKLMVRPERLALLGPADSADNVVEGTLDQVIMVGGVTKYYARVAGDRAVSATRLTLGPISGLERGQRVRLGWSADSTVLLTA